jgi:GT2 family glycosyltransferase
MLAAAVVIGTRNRTQLLARCLSALEAQTYRPAEIVVVNDASTDGTHAFLDHHSRRSAARLRAIHLPGQMGPAAARNRGIASCTSPLVAFTDDDCEPEPDWLRCLVSSLQIQPAEVAGVGGRVLAASPGLIGEYMTHHGILEPPPSLSYLVTANCAYRRAAIAAVGGFDERVKAPGGEDPGLAFALRKRGYRFELCPGAVVRHHYRESVIDFVKTFFRYGRGCGIVLGQ